MPVGATVAQPLLVPLLREHLAPGSLAWAVLPWKPEHGARTAETRPPVPAPTGVPWPLSLRYAGLEELLLSLSQNWYRLFVLVSVAAVACVLLGLIYICVPPELYGACSVPGFHKAAVPATPKAAQTTCLTCFGNDEMKIESDVGIA